MKIADGLNTKTALEHVIFLSNKNVVSVSRDLQITPQQFTDWIKLRRPIPEDRLSQLEQYFNVSAGVLADNKRFAKRLSALSGIELEMMVVENQIRKSSENTEEMEYRMKALGCEKEKQIRIARLSALLDKKDPVIMKKIDDFLNELEAN